MLLIFLSVTISTFLVEASFICHFVPCLFDVDKDQSGAMHIAHA